MSIFFWNFWRRLLSSTRPSNPARRPSQCRPLYSRRLELEWLEERIVPSLTLLNNYTGQDSALQVTLNGGAGEPPDTQGAAGPSNVVETVNQSIAIYSPKTTGSTAVTDSLNDFFFTQGKLPHLNVASGDSEGQSDPFTLYDPLISRFIVGNLDFEVDSNGNTVNGGGNAILLGVSKTSTPGTLTGSDWNFYEALTTASGIALQDYPGNPGYNADALVVTLNGFSTTADVGTQVNAISMAALTNNALSGTVLTLGADYFQTTPANLDILPRPATMPDSLPGGPMWMVAAPDSGGQGIPAAGANTIDVIEMTNVLSATPIFTTTTLTVNPYFLAVNPLQPNGSALTGSGFIDSRMMKTGEANDLLVSAQITSDAAGDEDNASWYEIDVSTGTPILVQQGAVSGGPNVYDTYPGIDINSNGDIGMTFQQSGSAEFESMYVTGRTPTDAPGTMETPVLIQAGTSNYTGFSGGPRQGDMTGINVDTDGSFWAFAEWANNEATPNWGTAVGHFTLGAPITILLTSATEGQALTNVPVATFIDASGVPLTSYTTTIDWGDGNVTSGTVVPGNGQDIFMILGSHTYINAGFYILTVTVNNGLVTIGPVSGTVDVSDAPLTGSAQALSGAVGNFVTNALVGIFTDTDPTVRPPSHYTATVDWSEGNALSFSSAGVIATLSNNSFYVYGSTPFTFPSGGLFTVRVVVTDLDGGASVTINSVVNVSSNPAIPGLLPLYQSDVSPVNAPFVSMEDALTNLLHAEQLFLTALAFGTMTEQQGSFGNLVNAFYAYEAAIFQYDIQLPGA